MEIIVEAVKLAAEVHSCQRRKKALPDIPKTGHLMEVAGIVQNNGGDAVTVAAALLHDAVEDHGVEVRHQIREKFGQEVLGIIESCTESETFPRPPWRERKEVYLKLVETASLPALLVIVADKLQNIRALLRRVKLEGAEGWGNPGRQEKLWYKQSLLEAMRQRLTQLEQETDHPTLVSVRLLIEEFAESVAALTHYETRMVRSAAHGDPSVATTAAVLAVLAQSACYHWQDEDGRDAYAIVRLDRKSDAHDLCPAMYDAYYLHGADEEGEPCTPWACTDDWLEHHAEHQAQPWALPPRLWALACADADTNGMRTQRPGVLPQRLWSLTYAAGTVQKRRSATASPGPASLEVMPGPAGL